MRILVHLGCYLGKTGLQIAFFLPLLFTFVFSKFSLRNKYYFVAVKMTLTMMLQRRKEIPTLFSSPYLKLPCSFLSRAIGHWPLPQELDAENAPPSS